MTRERLPWASALPGADLRSAPALDPAGLTLMLALRKWAAAHALEQKPRTQRRFDGTDTHAPDLDAIAAVEACEGYVRLIDGILRDPLLARRAVHLVRGEGENGRISRTR